MMNFDQATPATLSADANGAAAAAAATAAATATAAGTATAGQQQQQQQQLPPTVYIVVQPTPTSDSDHFRKNFPKRIVCSLGAGQVFVFVVALIVEILLITNMRYGPPISVGSGIWSGVVLGVAGVLGLLASWKPTSCSIISYMVLSIISAVFSAFPIVLASIGVGVTKDEYRYRQDQHSVTSTVALYSLLCFCGLCQLVLCVAASVLCCRGVCCRSRKTTGAVLYNATTPGGGGAAGAEAGGGAPGAAAAAQVQAALLPTVPLPSGTSATLTVGSDKPPKYEDATGASREDQEGSKYQRFE